MEKIENEMETREYMGAIIGVILGIYWDNGKQMETSIMGYMVMLGVYWGYMEDRPANT